MGFTGTDFTNWVGQEFGGMTPELETIHSRFSRECFDHGAIGGQGFGQSGNRSLYSLKTEYYFRLVEFQELEESRLASSQANENSTKAIIISMAAIVVTALIGLKQLYTPTTINSNQVNRMETKSFPITQKIESRQLNQVIDALEQSNINTAELARLIREQNKSEASVK